MIGEDGAQPVLFQQVADYAAPRWPDPARPQQLHLDIWVDDIDAAEEQALAIGAVRLRGRGRGQLAGLRRPGREAVLPPLPGRVGAPPLADARTGSTSYSASFARGHEQPATSEEGPAVIARKLVARRY